MATNAETLVVVTDANVLINLIRIGQLPLLGQLDGYRFLVPTEVANEITEPDQREALSEALAGGLSRTGGRRRDGIATTVRRTARRDGDG